MMKHAFATVIVFLFAVSSCTCLAQNVRAAKPVSMSAENRTDSPETAAILPWIYEKGTQGAETTAKEFLTTILTKSLYEVIPEARVSTAWIKDLGHNQNEDNKELPAPKELLKLGESLGVDWVITGRAVWHTRSIWIGLGPKTKSDCTVDMLIVDVKKKELALDAHNIKMDSTAKEDALKAAGAIILTPIFTVVSGGPKTPHEQRAVQLAITKAIQPWLAARPRVEKIDDSGGKKL
jgi:hypothetical protein